MSKMSHVQTQSGNAQQIYSTELHSCMYSIFTCIKDDVRSVLEAVSLRSIINKYSCQVHIDLQSLKRTLQLRSLSLQVCWGLCCYLIVLPGSEIKALGGRMRSQAKEPGPGILLPALAHLAGELFVQTVAGRKASLAGSSVGAAQGLTKGQTNRFIAPRTSPVKDGAGLLCVCVCQR